MAALQLVRPLMIKDFLELDDNSDSINGFQFIPRSPAPAGATVRFLLEAELVGSRSKGALTKITDAINNVIKNLPISSPTSARPKTKRRSLSKKITGRGFWRSSRTAKEEVVRVKDTVRLNTFDMCAAGKKSPLCFPSPVASSCGATSSSSGRSPSSSFDCPDLGEAARDSSAHSPVRMIAGVADAALSGHHQETKEKIKSVERECCTGCQSEEEKEQLSPVSVMNFPFQQEEEEEEEEEEDCNSETVSPCFEQSLANIERTRHQLLLNIPRFESLAELDLVDLVESFTNFEDHVPSDDDEDITKSTLIARLRSVGPHKRLLLDFYDEEMMWTDDMEELLMSAQKWIVGEAHLTVGDHGKVEMKDMDRNGRWRCFEDDYKEDLAVGVEVRILGSLVDELLLDILS